MRKFTILISLISFVTNIMGQITIAVNDTIIYNEQSIRIKYGDMVELSTKDTAANWLQFSPILKEYDNLSDLTQKAVPIEYYSTKKSNSNRLKLNNLPLGTYYFGISNNLFDTIATSIPLQHQLANCIQIIVRKDNSYLGILTEMLNLPFIIPPMHIEGYGHQTDLNIGTDCAELAIYGMRKLGYKIAYCGPKKIYKFLSPSTEVNEGNILHFGFQVSILFEDNGIKGEIDSEDLLIHAFQNSVKIEKFGNTKLFNVPYKLFQWKQ